jgi:pyridoxine 5-phosphate synthase
MMREERCEEVLSPEAVNIRAIKRRTGSQYFKKFRTGTAHRKQGSRGTGNLKLILRRNSPNVSQVNMLKLGVNIDHVATVREARYRGRSHGEPDPVEAALICEAAGAHGITAHLREDRRHIQDRDVWKLRKVITTRLNLEMANAPEIVSIALRVKPDIVCIVPERRQEVTTEGGLDVAGNRRTIAETCKKMRKAGIEVSLFIAPDEEQVEASAAVGAEFIELHTGSYAERYESKRGRETELKRLIAGAKLAHKIGLKVNAGHGLNCTNIVELKRVPHLVELNIGHSIVGRAISIGMTRAVKEMLQAMKGYRG